MATENLGKMVTIPASGNLSANQYHFIQVNGVGEAAVCGDGQDSDGVLQDDPAAQGRAAGVVVDGQTKVVAGGAVTVGAYVASNVNGHAVEAATGDFILGVALEPATTSGQVIAILFSAGHSLLT